MTQRESGIMREMDWPDLPPLSGEIIARDNLHVTAAPFGGALLISGDLDAAMGALAPGAPMLGQGGNITAATWAARIARDRALLVSGAPWDVVLGWHAGGYALTQTDDLWLTFTLTGAATARVIAEGTADPDAESPSASVLFAGQTCLLLRRGAGAVICAEAPRAWALAEWLKGAGG
jgi:hypothetical protein